MGLDSYFRKPAENDEDDTEYQIITIEFDGRQPNLIGGMFSSNGQDGSFRGKCYEHLIGALTLYSLYTEHMSNSDVMSITESLRRALYEEKSEEYKVLRGWFDSENNYYNFDIEHVEDLYRVFNAFALEGCDLFGWW